MYDYLVGCEHSLQKNLSIFHFTYKMNNGMKNVILNIFPLIFNLNNKYKQHRSGFFFLWLISK